MSAASLNWTVLLPALLVSAAAIVVLIVEAFSGDPERTAAPWISILGLGAAVVAALALWGPSVSGFGATVRADGYGLFFTVLVCLAAAVTVLMSASYLDTVPLPAGEYYALVLLATAGMIVLATAADLVVLFLGLEVMSVAVYALAGLSRSDVRSPEAALKYFLLGAFATAFLLYGIAFVYGATGATRLDEVAAGAGKGEPGVLLLLGLALLLVGLAFKVALIPFHAWVPDAYEGAPTTVTALMAVGVKAAAFAALGRVFLVAFMPLAEQWTGVLWVLAALTMTLGNVTALVQRNVKRMLAYSSIAHAGYALVGVVAASESGGSAVLFYLVAYAAMNLGAFGVVMALGRRGEPNEDLSDYAGVGFRHPVLGVAMGVFMLSLAGIPPTAGFAAKFYVFSAAVGAGYVGLAVIGVVNSLVSVAYYLRVLVQMFMVEEGARAIDPPASRPALLSGILITAAATLLLGLFPAWTMELARASFLSVR